MKPHALIASIALAAAAATPLIASAQPYGQYGFHRHNAGRPIDRSGRIASVNGGSFKLDDGTTVFLNHTTINPTGASLQPGERVEINGYGSGNGAINASTVNVERRGRRF